MTDKQGKFDINDGDKVYLAYHMTVIRRTRGGLCLCLLGDKEVSIPEYMLRNQACQDFIEGRRIK